MHAFRPGMHASSGDCLMIAAKMSLYKKIIGASLASVFLISALSVGISLYLSSSLLQQKNTEINRNVLRQNVNNIESIMSKTGRYAAIFAKDEQFSEMLSLYSSTASADPETEKKLEKFLYELIGSYKEIQFFYLITPDGKLLSNDQFANHRLDYAYFNDKFGVAGSDYAWSYLNYELNVFSDSVLLTIRMRDALTGAESGILSFTVNNNYFTNFYTYANTSGKSFTMLTADFKPVLSALTFPEGVAEKIRDGVSLSPEGHFRIGQTLYMFYQSVYTGWIGVETIDLGSRPLSVLKAFKYSFVVFLFCAALSYVLAHRYASAFSKSINGLRKGMNKAIAENLKTRISFNHPYRWSYRNSLLALFIFTILIPVLISLTLIYFMFIDALKEEIVHHYDGTLYSLKTEIEGSFDNYEQAAHYVAFNDRVVQAAKDVHRSGNANPVRDKDIERIVLMQQKIRGGAFYVNIWSADKKPLYSSIPMNREDSAYYTDLMEASGLPKQFFGTKPDYYNRNVITLGKKIFDIAEPDHSLGYLFLSMYENDIAELYGKYMSGDKMNTFIIDKNGSIVSDTRKEMIGKNITQIYANVNWPQQYGSSGYVTEKHGGKQYLVNYSFIRNTDMVLVSRVQIVDLLRNSILDLNLFIALTSLLVVFLLSYLLANHITKPLHKLSRAIREVTEGDFSVQIGDGHGHGNEVEELSRNFNHMVVQLQALIKEVYESKIERQQLELQKKEAELSAFQAQIQPHFLYNTLEVIHCKAMFLTEGDNDVSYLIAKLADFLRFVTNDSRSYISLREEIGFSRTYADIMQNSGNELEYRWYIDEHLEACKVPKLIIQPLLENAINHGLQKLQGRPGRICVFVQEKRGNLFIRVADNGAGISRERLAVLRTPPEALDSGSHIGLNNVRQRIALSFGPQFGLRLASRPGKGTIVTIVCPIRL